MRDRVAFRENDFLLRKMKGNDIWMVLQWRNAESNRHFMYNNREISEGEHRKWFSHAMEQQDAEYFIFENRGAPIGFVSITNINEQHARCSWAFNLSDKRDSFPKGLGAVMELLAIEVMFQHSSIEKICCEVLDFNVGVIRLHKRFGFKEEGVFKRHIRRNDGVFDVIPLALFRQDWEVRRESIRQSLFGEELH